MYNIIKPVIFDYSTNKHYIEELIKEYPFLSAEICGRSALGRGIFSLSVGNARNSVIIAAGFHGSEWLTCLTALLFTERVCHCIKSSELLCGIDIKRAFSQLGVTVIPCVNPDGTEIAVHGPNSAGTMHTYVRNIPCEDYRKWNANAMGVDINHNFNAGWHTLRQMETEKGIIGPSMKQYGGSYPESEAETKSLTRLCRIKNFRQCLAIHSQGEEIYWHYGESTPHQSSMMAKILASSCNYTLKEPTSLAGHGGFKDWFISEMKKPGFTIEIGKGENPLPIKDLYKIYARIEEALTLFCLM